ncbi:extensin-like domain-containing protein [Aureimonas ureilytica]|uniref:extensin-like domain-containing protein n=1 Tax=Aureimonas ureilytica TaxID=401562 RepID=UPI00037CD5A8|nr:extensin family protein [Aureimonas ureilytica]
MVLRKTGWRIVTLAVAVYATASADKAAEALDSGFPMPPMSSSSDGSAPEGRDARTGGRLVWGGSAPTEGGYVPSPAFGDPPPSPPVHRRAPAPAKPRREPPPVAARAVDPAPLPEPERGPGDYGRTYPVQEAGRVQEAGAASLVAPEPVDDPIGRMIEQASLEEPPPGVLGAYGARPEAEFDPWEGLTEAEPAEPELDAEPEDVPAPAPARRARPDRTPLPSYASLSSRVPPATLPPGPQGALERETPDGYRPMAGSDAQCRRELRKLGVRFTDISPISTSRSCAIPNPVRITEAAKGIAMMPAATMNCQAALRVARWLENDVKPAARWKLWKRPTAVINMSSYRCSRIAGSRTISEHASGNALDVGGFRFSDGSTMRISPKGVFSFREKGFQSAIRQGSCRYFGTVLGPGYNRAHADHLHLDVKTRLRPTCK